MSRDDAPRAAALRDALVARMRDAASEPLSDGELFAYAEGRLETERQAQLRERLVREPEARERLREIREFALAEAQMAPAADRQAEVTEDLEARPEVDADWSGFLERVGEASETSPRSADLGDAALGDAALGDAALGDAEQPLPAAARSRLWPPALAGLALAAVLVLFVFPNRRPTAEPSLGWSEGVAASRGAVVFEVRSGPVRSIMVAEGERLQLEVFHPALPSECADTVVRVLRDGRALPASDPERVDRWLRIEISGVEGGRHTVELRGCGVDAVAEIEVVRPEGR